MDRKTDENAGVLLLKRRLICGGVRALVGRMMTTLLMLASNALLARLLSPQDLGAYFLALSVVTAAALLGSLGLNSAAVRFVAESMGLDQPGRARRIVGTAVGLRVLGALGIGLVYLLLGEVLGELVFQAPALAAITGLVAGWIAVMSLRGLLAEIFRGFHDIRLATVFGNFGGLISGGLLVTALALMWLLGGQATLATVVLLAASSSCASTLLAGWSFRRKTADLPLYDGERTIKLREVWGVSWPLLAASVAIYTFRGRLRGLLS